jgi:hypothetical protein
MFRNHILAAVVVPIVASSSVSRAELGFDSPSSKLEVRPAVLSQAIDQSTTPVTQVQYRRGYYRPYRGYAYGYPYRSNYSRYGYGYYPRSYGYYGYRYPSYGYSYYRPYYGGYYPRYYTGYRGGFSYYGPRFYGSYYW